MHHAIMTPPSTEAPSTQRTANHERTPVSSAVAAKYARQARQMYEAQPHMSLLNLIRLVAQVLVTGKAPRRYKL